MTKAPAQSIEFRNVFGADADDLDAAVNALAAETDPYCLYVAVKGVGNEMRTRKEIADFIFRMADHENPLIRKRAANYIGSRLAAEVEGTTEKIIAMMADEDQDVRGAACKVAGDQQNEAVIEPLVAILNNPSRPFGGTGFGPQEPSPGPSSRSEKLDWKNRPLVQRAPGGYALQFVMHPHAIL